MRNPILVTGATGLLGGTLVSKLRESGHEVLTLARGEGAQIRVDLASAAELHSALDEIRPKAIVNLAALADVDGCERDPALAYRLNSLAVENLGAWTKRNQGSLLVHISTDMVYDGPGLKTEDAIVTKNVYALSKRCGELAGLLAGATVLRTNFFGHSKAAGRSSFSDWLLKSFREGTSLKLFTDVWFSPLSMETLSEKIELVLSRPVAGVFNLGSREGMTKRDFAHEIAKEYGLSAENAVDCRLQDLGLKASRPLDMRMDVTKFETAFATTLPTLRQEIQLLRRLT